MPALMGIETEYGILATDEPDLDPVWLSALVVDAHPGPASGHVLDPTDPLPMEDAHNRVLGNGARFYVDHAHPEYSGPEVTSAAEAVRYDLAGDAILADCAARATAVLGSPIRIFKNNTDSQGSSYGCHENYLLARSTPWQRVVARFTGFLVSRTIVSGAGRVGLGRFAEEPGFQLSQRADFFETTVGIETTRHRPIINTRDEPHADPERWRRLHVITGDANRSAWSTWLKLGSAAAVLAALEAEALPAFVLADPVEAMQAVSHDPSALLQLADGRRLRALDLQRAYHEAAVAHAVSVGSTSDLGVLEAWGEVLDDFGSEPSRLADRLDWAAKKALFEAYAARDGLGWESPRLAQLDLAWAELSPASPFEALLRAGRFRPFPHQLDVAGAVAVPPSDTRARRRGEIVTRDPDAVVAASWDWMVVLDRDGRRCRIDLSDPFGA